ncbi:MAG: SsrA-binding protein [Parcubacteria group bacterium CG11_big_fil_rev_8_21_14_0_20_39_22]|nr:MAG: SsrA-binding protein [Parcubacteria group bacterium CG11_big_fil_rev_8_21_14_0_20_39_22]
MRIANKKALSDYEIKDKIESGIELLGFEVKSIRNGQMSLDGSYVIVRGNEAFLVGATVSPYQVFNTPDDYDPSRNRKLLLKKKEMEILKDAEKQKGLTIVPLSVYNKGRFFKVEIAVGRGRKKHDKRQVLKKREADREIDRTLKR